VLEEKKQQVGFRRARVVEEELEGQEGLSFLFEVNNIRIFCGGLPLRLLFSSVSHAVLR
jgi:beta-mannosidase